VRSSNTIVVFGRVIFSTSVKLVACYSATQERSVWLPVAAASSPAVLGAPAIAVAQQGAPQTRFLRMLRTVGGLHQPWRRGFALMRSGRAGEAVGLTMAPP
jgi:hypothetical protein